MRKKSLFSLFLDRRCLKGQMFQSYAQADFEACSVVLLTENSVLNRKEFNKFRKGFKECGWGFKFAKKFVLCFVDLGVFFAVVKHDKSLLYEPVIKIALINSFIVISIVFQKAVC